MRLASAGEPSDDPWRPRGRRQPARTSARARDPRPARAGASSSGSRRSVLRNGPVGAVPGDHDGGSRCRDRPRGPRARRARGCPTSVTRHSSSISRSTSWRCRRSPSRRSRRSNELDDPLGLALAERLLGQALSRQGRWTEGLAAVERAAAHAEASGDQTTRRDIIQTALLASRRGSGAQPHDAIRRLEELLQSTGDDRVLEAVVGRELAAPLAMAGRFDDAREHLERSAPVLDELDLELLVDDPVRRRRGEGAHRRSRRRRARADGALAEAGRHRGRSDRVSGAAGRLSPRAPLLRRGPLGRGRRVSQLRPGVPEPTVFHHLATVLRTAAKARLAAHRGEHAEALRLARLAVEARRHPAAFSTSQPASGSRSPMCTRQPARPPRPTPPSRRRSASTRRKGTSPPPLSLRGSGRLADLGGGRLCRRRDMYRRHLCSAAIQDGCRRRRASLPPAVIATRFVEKLGRDGLSVSRAVFGSGFCTAAGMLLTGPIGAG